jgi:L,D-peptidoglycan transpeptidase YkuD (ErfK/YbiS/YcfS/YnhG family)
MLCVVSFFISSGSIGKKLYHYTQLIKVFQSPISRSRGVLIAGNIHIPCALGRTGLRHDKREGDGKSPIGVFTLHKLWWRDDRVIHPLCGLQKRPIRSFNGWCDDIRSPHYNRPVQRPFTFSHEEMLREDHIYNYVIEIGCNMKPVKRGRGSAIFLHLARDNFEATAGCVAVPHTKIARLLAVIGPKTRIQIS